MPEYDPLRQRVEDLLMMVENNTKVAYASKTVFKAERLKAFDGKFVDELRADVLAEVERLDRQQRTGCAVCGETKPQMEGLPEIGDVCGECDAALRQHYLLDSVEMRIAGNVMAALEKHRAILDETFPDDAEAIDLHLRAWRDCMAENARK